MREMTRTQLAWWLLRKTKGVRLMWLVATCARIVNQLLTVVALVLVGALLVDRGPVTLLWWIAGLLLVKAGFRYLEHYAGHWVAFMMLTKLRGEFYQALVPQAPAVTKRVTAAEMSDQATRDIDRVEVFFAHTVPPAVSAVVVPVVAALWAGFALGWGYALVMAVAAAVMMMIPEASRALSWADSRTLARMSGGIAIHLGDSVQGLREVAAFEAEPVREEQLRELEADAESVRRRIRLRTAVRAGLLVAVELGAAGVLVAVGGVGPGQLGATVVAVLAWIGLWAPLRGVDDFADGLDEALASAQRVHATITAEPAVIDVAPAEDRPDEVGASESGNSDNEADGQTKTHPREPIPGSVLVEVKDVSFSYPGQPGGNHSLALQDVSLQVAAGSWTYLVGVSGSGKSTLAALLARAWDPEQGELSYGGVNLADMPLSHLRERVRLVPQRPSLLHATLAENLRLSNPAASDQELAEALHIVDLAAWAQSLPGGLAEEIAPDGNNISGGQIQRLAIARALLSRPRLLILDEATSQLDRATAAVVRQRIRAAFPDLTVLEVSHQADRIPSPSPVVVLDAGRVVESGLAGQLQETPGSYFARILERTGPTVSRSIS